jgi:hypothetical protein
LGVFNGYIRVRWVAWVESALLQHGLKGEINLWSVKVLHYHVRTHVLHHIYIDESHFEIIELDYIWVTDKNSLAKQAVE